MAAGDRLLDSDGNEILDSSGNVQLSDGAGDDCCCGGCPECDSTPSTITITLTIPITTNPGLLDTETGDVSGTYDLTYEGSIACIWSITGAATGMTYTTYTDASKTVVVSTGPVLVDFTLSTIGGSWQMGFVLYSDDGGIAWGSGPQGFLITTGENPPNCAGTASGPVIANAVIATGEVQIN